jgi:hypothetical protein
MGMKPTLPPKAPPGPATGVAAGVLVVPGTTSVLLSELARPGSGASVEDEAAAELPSEAGAPTMGTAEESAVDVEGRGASDVADDASESPGGGMSPDWLAAPWDGSGARDELASVGWGAASADSELASVDWEAALVDWEAASVDWEAASVGWELASVAWEADAPGCVAAGGFPATLVFRASSGTETTVTPTPPVATTAPDAPPELAPPTPP